MMFRLLAAVVLCAWCPMAAAEWLQRERLDKMTDQTRVTAILPSQNSADIGAPYGVVKAAIMLGKTQGGDLETAGFSIQRGIIECNDTCRIFIRFDDSEPTMLRVNATGGGTYNTIFFEDPKGFADKLKNAKRITVQPRLYGSGSHVFEFHQGSPLNW